MAGKTLKIDERAVQVIAAQYSKLRTLGASWGTWHEHYIAAKDSHAKVVESLFMSGFGDTAEVWRDDDLSLIVHEGNFTYGIVWFPHKRTCTVPGCNAYLREDGTAYRYGDRSTWTGCEAGEHTPDIPYDRATPGTWSTHS